MHIGLKIKQLVELKKISPQELARKIGKKSKQSIYDYYKKESIDTAVLQKIADALEIPITAFFEDSENTNNNTYTSSIHDRGKNIYQKGTEHNKGESKDIKELENEITRLQDKVSYQEKQINYLEQRLADKDEIIKQKDELINMYKERNR